MGFTTVKVDIANATTPSRRGEVEVLVDTGALYTMVPRRILAELGVEPRRKIEFELANGTRMVRDVGEARFYFNGDDAVSRVIFGEDMDASVLGVVTLEEMGLAVDPVNKRIGPARMILY